MAQPRDGNETPDRAEAGVTSRPLSLIRLRMRLVMAAEQLLLLATPICSVVALFLILSWLGWFRAVPEWLRLGSLGLLALAGLASLWPFSHFRPAAGRAIDERIERQNLIRHQAVAVQDDRIDNDDAFARALWQEHQRRMARQIGQLSTGIPRSNLPERDPYGGRVAVVLMLITAGAYSLSSGSGRIADAFMRHDRASLPDIRIDAWISPPSYVSKPPVFLTGLVNNGQGPVEAIVGSQITVRLGGASPDAAVSWRDAASGESRPLPAADPALAAAAPTDRGSPQSTVFTYKPTADGVLEVAAGTAPRQWPIRMLPDQPPVASFVEEPRRAVNGALELDYTLSDDHGLVSAEAEIVPLDSQGPDARPLFEPPKYRLTLPRRNSADNRATSSQDLTEHPLAGQKVRITLVATDGAGQQGRSETLETVLPGRRFSEPLAAAVVEQRGLVALDANNVDRALELNDALMVAPEETIPNLIHYLLMKSVRGRLAYAHNDDDLRAAVDYLWGVALQIEDGNLSLAERRLRDAQRALSEALENGATDEEIAKLMDELREAMQEYMQALARQAESNQAQQQPMDPQNMLRQRDLENMLDQIENLARSGAREQAQQMLSELQRMMNNLQAGRQQRQQQQGGPMRQQMDKLGEMMRQQQQLMDQTFRLDQQGRQMQPGEGGDEQQQEGQDGQSQQQQLGELSQGQQALRDALGQLQKDLEAMGITPSEGFGEAGEAMGDAAGDLGEGETGNALSNQGKALQALRQGAEDMMNQMMQAMGNEQGEAEGEGAARTGNRNSDDRDPLGRPRATTGPDFGSRVKVPDEIDIQRAREILDAIRKRLGDQLGPDVEKRYLERLLDLQ
ncbi:uncharacterized protein (TIGR02302 family) [Hoeflea marina]|uniref:Uncharacterized protein (TIGR02302 family) n=1 Tax=Hoeflea marina TaxID=274592 RepID=A0A317PDZ3_9HYPH|nr:TIGR02302 family protein [Hoeflea marina]PWV98085.1 uncharacterized protein (TIGR02302 family) [Hoeflea marina]